VPSGWRAAFVDAWRSLRLFFATLAVEGFLPMPETPFTRRFREGAERKAKLRLTRAEAYGFTHSLQPRARKSVALALAEFAIVAGCFTPMCTIPIYAPARLRRRSDPALSGLRSPL
jgi:hypothetical protein